MSPILNSLQELVNLTLTVKNEDKLSLFKSLVLAETVADNYRSLISPTDFLAMAKDYNNKLDELRAKISEFAKTLPQEDRKNILAEAGRQLPGYFVD